jgi:hypothetical protein
MEKILIAAVLACQSGYRLVDWHDRVPRGIDSADMVVTVSPFYTRLLIYPAGHPELTQRCCNNRQISVLRVQIGDGRFCIGQSQPQMKWNLQLTFKPELQM